MHKHEVHISCYLQLVLSQITTDNITFVVSLYLNQSLYVSLILFYS